MFDRLEILRLAGELASHAASRQGAIAENVANADTPGFRARDLPSFGEVYDQESAFQLRATRPEHLSQEGEAPRWNLIDSPDQESPNGNTVSIEDQMLRAAEVRKEHDTALAVYSTTMDILRTTLGKR